jgi:death-on-curing protein
MSLQSEPRWLRADIVRTIHEAQIAEHGGIAGVRSEELLDSALARPRTRAAFDDAADLIAIGATYAIAIARNHPFLDGNKRVAWVAMRTFFALNGVTLTFEPAAAVEIMLALAADAIDDDAFTDWVRDHAAR